MPKEVVETTDDNEVTEGLDDATTLEVATPSVTPESKTKGKEPQGKKLELTPEELEAKVEAAVQAKLHEREEAARREEAIKQGNFENLYKDAQDRIYELELNSWKNKALTKYKLGEDFFEALSGSTEEEVLKSAQKLKKAIDVEVAQAVQTETPPPSGKRSAPREIAAPDVTRDILRHSFIPRSVRRH